MTAEEARPVCLDSPARPRQADRTQAGEPAGSTNMAQMSKEKRMNLGKVGAYGSVDHGRPGKLQDARHGATEERIHTGDPDELESKTDGRTR